LVALEATRYSIAPGEITNALLEGLVGLRVLDGGVGGGRGDGGCDDGGGQGEWEEL
jgi:hypothetical protein